MEAFFGLPFANELCIGLWLSRLQFDRVWCHWAMDCLLGIILPRHYLTLCTFVGGQIRAFLEAHLSLSLPAHWWFDNQTVTAVPMWTMWSRARKHVISSFSIPLTTVSCFHVGQVRMHSKPFEYFSLKVVLLLARRMFASTLKNWEQFLVLSK